MATAIAPSPRKKSLPRRVLGKAGKKGRKTAGDAVGDVFEDGCGCGCLTLALAGLAVPRLARMAARRLR